MTTSKQAIVVVVQEKYGTATRFIIRSDEYAVPRLVRELAEHFQTIAPEIGGSVEEVAGAIRSFGRSMGNQPLDALHMQDFGLNDLRTRHLDAWERQLAIAQSESGTDTPYRRAVHLFALLRRFDDDQPGTLHSGVSRRVRQQTRLSHIRRAPDADHTDEESRRIRSAAHRLVYDALCIAQEDPDYLPNSDVIAALHVLLSLATGEPPEVLRSLTIDDLKVTPEPGRRADWPRNPSWSQMTDLARADGIQSFAVTFTKRRAGVRYDEVFTRSDHRAAHQSLTRLLVLTAAARTQATDRSLWLTRKNLLTRQMDWRKAGLLSTWYRQHVKGAPISVPHKFSRLRKTKLRRESSADPVRYLKDGRRHTARTFFEHYTNSAVLRAEAGAIVVETIGSYFDIATGPTIITPEAEAMLRAGATVEVLDPGTATALISGQLEGALCACRNPLDSPHAPAGDLCPVAQMGHCFGCPNGIVTERHLPALLVVEEISSPQEAPNLALWKEVWEPIQRGTRAILPLFPADAIARAREHVDKVHIDLGLRNDLRGTNG
ncbi:hypothetical protein [Salinibacterium sp. ZJ450]|uniref:hypothetical protein n=1 Tax=Salinibacterium sp. ZJ450 TaxID=2708338 RepID=UPI00141DF863|nr:hypothetical protein [Salinibacterium sp. ZJ450]